ncbi:hypothetical protein [Actinoplanes xinjiangensis]|uniref:hypothetical protein n=1 Tax=Actinoplanes xinjiangensis TaxID=512350 RepID=UPI003413B43E
MIMRRHHERGIRMCLGGTVYNLADKADRTSLKVLGAVGSEDDPERRKKLLGSRLMAMALGGAALADSQMPYGWVVDTDRRGRPRKVKGQGLVPIAVAADIPALAEAYRMHAEGSTYQSICATLAEFEARGGIQRRSGQRYDLTFSEGLDDYTRAYDAALTVFQAHWSVGVPRPDVPTEEAVLAYEAGDDPIELFSPEQLLVISRPELLRTGIFHRALVNDIRGRGLQLAGFTPRYADDYDETGVFFVSARWPWPVDPATGQDLPRFGISDETLRRSGARLLRSLRAPKKRTGGQAHIRVERRVLQGFGTWLLDDGREATLIARMNNSGRANMVLLHREVSSDAAAGWTKQLSTPAESIAATVNLDVLCGDVAYRIGEAVAAQLDPAVIAPARALIQIDSTDQHRRARAGLLARAEAAEQAADKAEKAARGARTNASVVAADGNEHEAAEYRADAVAHGVEARKSRQEAENCGLRPMTCAGNWPTAIRTSAWTCRPPPTWPPAFNARHQPTGWVPPPSVIWRTRA